MEQIFCKLDVSCTNEALVKAVRLNLISTWDDKLADVC